VNWIILWPIPPKLMHWTKTWKNIQIHISTIYSENNN